MTLADNTEAKGLLQITSQFKKLNQVTADFHSKNISNIEERLELITNSYIEAIKNSPNNHPLLKKWIYLINSAYKRIQYADSQLINTDTHLEILCSLITWDEMELLRNFTKVQGASHEAHINKDVKTNFQLFSNKYNEVTRPPVFIS